VRFFILLCWVLVLSWATHFIASPVWRTPVVTQELLSKADAALTTNWTTNGSQSDIIASADGGIRIERDIEKYHRIFQNIPLLNNSKLLRFQAQLSTNTSVVDRFNWKWRAPTVLFLRLPAGDRRGPFSEAPMFFNSVVHLDEVIELQRPYDSIELSFVKPRHASWQLSNVNLSETEQHPRYVVSQFVLAGFWLITLCIGIYRAWCRAPLPTAVVVSVLGGVLGAVLASKNLVDLLYSVLKKLLNSVGGGITSGQFSSLTQSGHIILFAVLTFVVLVFHKHWNLWYTQVVLGIGVLAVATEALQRHAFGRSPDVQDFVLDLVGIFVGLVVFAFFRGFYKALASFLTRSA